MKLIVLGFLVFGLTLIQSSPVTKKVEKRTAIESIKADTASKAVNLKESSLKFHNIKPLLPKVLDTALTKNEDNGKSKIVKRNDLNPVDNSENDSLNREKKSCHISGSQPSKICLEVDCGTPEVVVCQDERQQPPALPQLIQVTQPALPPPPPPSPQIIQIPQPRPQIFQVPQPQPPPQIIQVPQQPPPQPPPQIIQVPQQPPPPPTPQIIQVPQQPPPPPPQIIQVPQQQQPPPPPQIIQVPQQQPPPPPQIIQVPQQQPQPPPPQIIQVPQQPPQPPPPQYIQVSQPPPPQSYAHCISLPSSPPPPPPQVVYLPQPAPQPTQQQILEIQPQIQPNPSPIIYQMSQQPAPAPMQASPVCFESSSSTGNSAQLQIATVETPSAPSFQIRPYQLQSQPIRYTMPQIASQPSTIQFSTLPTQNTYIPPKPISWLNTPKVQSGGCFHSLNLQGKPGLLQQKLSNLVGQCSCTTSPAQQLLSSSWGGLLPQGSRLIRVPERSADAVESTAQAENNNLQSKATSTNQPNLNSAVSSSA